MSDIPEDLKLNIIARLPMKSICKSRCVSKTWKDIISSAHFKNLHKEISKRNPQVLVLDQFLFNENGDGMVGIRLSSMDMHGHVHFSTQWVVKGYIDMFSSNNGLVGFANNNKLYICNPCMKQMVCLPVPTYSSLENAYVGLGYNEVSNKYIMIHLFDTGMDEDEDEDEYEFGREILTISEGELVSSQSWKEMKGTCVFALSRSGVYVNNSFYWMVDNACSHRNDELIISYNIEEEKFEVIPHPNDVSFQEDNAISIVELNGFLCLVVVFAISSKMDVWILKDHKNNMWAKEISVDLTNLEGFDDEMIEINPLEYLDGNIIMAAGNKGVHYYNVEAKTFTKVRGINLSRISRICVYKETLFSLKT